MREVRSFLQVATSSDGSPILQRRRTGDCRKSEKGKSKPPLKSSTHKDSLVVAAAPKTKRGKEMAILLDCRLDVCRQSRLSQAQRQFKRMTKAEWSKMIEVDKPPLRQPRLASPHRCVFRRALRQDVTYAAALKETRAKVDLKEAEGVKFHPAATGATMLDDSVTILINCARPSRAIVK
ncbi:unnamed protein product [Pieris macdunnoughi]|uniref:Uncharacterized protein n=1 Tax=Pieris macdunnoughi TaxID=345717 RepID=A0A821M0J7_9NEOP|nr:unnamed protein product [Pieris macdunnoughi]